MNLEADVLIIGGGLAGLTSALHLQRAGVSVILIEKISYPFHKVCGEYISNEVLPYLAWLNVDIESLKPTHINKLHLTTQLGKSVKANLPSGGFGISRYTLDHYLYNQLIERGVTVLEDNVINVTFENDNFSVETAKGTQVKAKQVLGAFGKRSNLDVKLDRAFINEKSPFLAVKGHYKGEFPADVVALHSFTGGYCGVSKVEDDKINICYIANYKTFKDYKNISLYQREVLSKNTALKTIFDESELLFEAPLTISQLSFEKKEAVKNHILMIGDTAGLIHPLCGNGMAMAITCAKVASELLIKFFKEKPSSRAELEKTYTKIYGSLFNGRLKMGGILSSLLQNEKLADFSLNILAQTPFLLHQIIKRTHGKPLITND